MATCASLGPRWQYDHDEVVELLLEEVAWEINHRDSKGDTALLYAIRWAGTSQARTTTTLLKTLPLELA